MSETPVGDHLRAKFGDWETTHALGTDKNPAGCAAWHSYCAYLAGRAEGLRDLAEYFERCQDDPMFTGGDSGTAAGLRFAARMARHRAEPAADGLAGAGATEALPFPENRPEGRPGATP